MFNDSSKYKNVNVSDLNLSKKEAEQIMVTFKLCLVVMKADAGFIEDVFINEAKTGTLFGKPVVEGSVKFTALG